MSPSHCSLIEIELLNAYPIEAPGMMSISQIRHILFHLRHVIESNIEGDVVELGCHAGSTSLFIRRLLMALGSKKAFHVYDSWEGLPAKSMKDGTAPIQPGELRASQRQFLANFQKWDLVPPIMHSGWFNEIPDHEYPEKVCFAFFDGDIYQSILDSFNLIYSRIPHGGRLIVDDYDHPRYPGCQIACREFLQDKPEMIELLPDDTGRASLGLMIKQ